MKTEPHPQYLKPGQEVKFRKQFGSLHHGIIKAVWISNHGVAYQVMYFNQGRLDDPYVPREMFEVVNEEPIAAGFQLNKPKEI